MKKILFITLALIFIVCAVSCNADTNVENKEASYKNDVKTNDIASAIKAKLTNESVLFAADNMSVDELYFHGFNSEYTPLISEFSIMYSSTSTLFDEFGIFKVENTSDTEDIVTMINEFTQAKIEGDMGYVPEELPKLENAKTKICGNYVLYVFLSEEDTATAFAEFEEILKK